MDDWFKDRRWRVLTEADGEGSVTDVKTGQTVPVMFRKGRFRVEPPFAFASPLGNTGRNGVMLVEIDSQDHDLPVMHPFGESVVKKAREVYHAVV